MTTSGTRATEIGTSFINLFAGFVAGVVESDEHGVVTATNRAFCDMVGLPESSVVGAAPPYPWWPEDQIAWFRAQLGHHLESAVARGKFEGEFQAGDGSRLHVVGGVSPLLRSDGSTHGVLFTVRDARALRSAIAAMVGEREPSALEGLDVEETMRRLFESDLVGITSGVEGRIQNANNAFLNMVGYTRADLEGGGIDEAALTPPEWLDEEARAGEALLRTGTAGPVEKQYWRRDGTRVWVRVATAAMRWEPLEWVAFVEDITAGRAAEDALRQSEERFRNLTTNLPDIVFRYRFSPPQFEFVSDASADVLGYSPAEFYADPGLPVTLTDPADRSAAEAFWRQAAVSGEPLVCRKRHRNGGLVWTETRATAILGETGVVGLDGVERDITRYKELEAELAHRALHDPLTGVANRTLLMEQVEAALKRLDRHRHLVAVAVFDMDLFKEVNDVHGHAVGDELLRQVTARVSRLIRAGDTLGRLGGDEFVVLLDEIGSPAEAEEIVARIEAELDIPFDIDGVVVAAGASIGVALAASADVDPRRLLTEADSAMYHAKGRRRQRVRR